MPEKPKKPNAYAQEAEAGSDPLWFLRDRDALIKRFILAEVLKPPLARRGLRRAK
jgi:hypothetical protein